MCYLAAWFSTEGSTTKSQGMIPAGMRACVWWGGGGRRASMAGCFDCRLWASSREVAQQSTAQVLYTRKNAVKLHMHICLAEVCRKELHVWGFAFPLGAHALDCCAEKQNIAMQANTHEEASSASAIVRGGQVHNDFNGLLVCFWAAG